MLTQTYEMYNAYDEHPRKYLKNIEINGIINISPVYDMHESLRQGKM